LRSARGNVTDSVAVAGGPLQNSRALEQVQFVMKEGCIYLEKQ
jgi:hypothetical protein